MPPPVRVAISLRTLIRGVCERRSHRVIWLISMVRQRAQGFNDEVFDLDHVLFAHECASDIPGHETDALSVIARQYESYIIAQAKAHHPD